MQKIKSKVRMKRQIANGAVIGVQYGALYFSEESMLCFCIWLVYQTLGTFVIFLFLLTKNFLLI